MANYYATTRSNYFRVKDEAAFKAWCGDLSLDWWTKQFDGQEGTFFAVSADTSSGWPSSRFVQDPNDPDVEDDEEVDLTTELAKHLDPRDAAVLIEIGNEKLRYLCGYATAVTADGREHSISLSTICEEAAEAFGPDINVTEATY
ncbi:conserved hypothetical protein [Hyphomicrobium sp. GJ21]|uniref:hypothetical protein n=1 Tax=Hyphomicrobium sp. GJ21 TaxID=113574 RepID=UPI00041B95B7|nr:hypothetical protein [Hyphomicrobium sp. GJ21]CEJ88092.1 conserved hypothetical protein [Hyphomicrobium sp. GJ21]